MKKGRLTQLTKKIPGYPRIQPKDFYAINSLIFMLFIVLFVMSEFITHFISGMFGFLLYADWMFIFLMLLVFMKFKGHIHTNVRNFFITLMVLPMIRMITIIFPFPSIDFLYQTIIVYGIMLLMSIFYVIYLKIDLKKLCGTHFFLYLPITSLVVLAIAFVLFSVKKSVFSLILDKSWFLILISVIIISLANTIYFRGILQYLGERIMGPRTVILLLAILSVILVISQKSLVLMFGLFVLGSIIGMIFHETKNLYMVAIIEFVFTLFYLVIFPSLL